MEFVYYAYPVNMPDPIRKRFGYSQLRPLRPACSQNRAGLYRPDQTSSNLFSSVFRKKSWIILHKTGPNPARVWLNASGLEASRCAGFIGPGFWQDATGPLPVSHFQTPSLLPQTSRIILYKTSPDLIYFWLIVSGFDQMDPVRKQANVQESSGPLLAKASQPIRPDVNRIRLVYWVFAIFFFISLFACGYVLAFSLGFQTGIRQTYQKEHGHCMFNVLQLSS